VIGRMMDVKRKLSILMALTYVLLYVIAPVGLSLKRTMISSSGPLLRQHLVVIPRMKWSFWLGSVLLLLLGRGDFVMMCHSFILSFGALLCLSVQHPRWPMSSMPPPYSH